MREWRTIDRFVKSYNSQKCVFREMIVHKRNEKIFFALVSIWTHTLIDLINSMSLIACLAEIKNACEKVHCSKNYVSMWKDVSALFYYEYGGQGDVQTLLLIVEFLSKRTKLNDSNTI